jgi:hypothetical protein
VETSGFKFCKAPQKPSLRCTSWGAIGSWYFYLSGALPSSLANANFLTA